MSIQSLHDKLEQLADEARSAARSTILGPWYEAQAKAYDTSAELVREHGVSPWRSLKDDPPAPPTEQTDHALLVRAHPLDRDLDDDRYRLIVPHRDSDNDVLEDVIEWGYVEWMEVPK